MNPTVAIVLNFAFDFVITAGSIVGGAMLVTSPPVMPTPPVWVLALVMGVVSAGRRAQAAMSPAPEAAKSQQAEIDALVARITTAVKAAQPVTPQRVPDESHPLKDSS
jgi:hypothetical protein